MTHYDFFLITPHWRTMWYQAYSTYDRAPSFCWFSHLQKHGWLGLITFLASCFLWRSFRTNEEVHVRRHVLCFTLEHSECWGWSYVGERRRWSLSVNFAGESSCTYVLHWRTSGWLLWYSFYDLDINIFMHETLWVMCACAEKPDMSLFALR